MARLPEESRTAAETAESGTFDLMEPHTLHYRLRDIDTTRPPGPKGPYWVWEYECLEAPYKGRRQWNNTSLSAGSAVFVRQTYDALGAELDEDTDELLGRVVRLQVGERVIQQGERKGEKANQVSRVLKPNPDFDADGETAPADREESIF